MNWYYVEAGQQAGPVDDAALGQLVAAGKILPDTLVWKEGMANWLPYSQVMPVGAAPAGGPVPPMPVASGVEEAVCAECGKIFPVNDTIRVGQARVCASCKPIFVQKMREGVNVAAPGSFHYAGFWIRVAAKLLDGLILAVVFCAPIFIVFFVIAFNAARSGQPHLNFIPQDPSVHAAGTDGAELMAGAARLVFQMIGVGLNIIYTSLFLGKYGATPGKMICRLKVVNAGGDKISYGRAFGRGCAELLSGLICYIGYIMAGFDEEKRALHDRICNTRVIYK